MAKHVAPLCGNAREGSRAPRGVENQGHWCLDVAFKDNQMRAQEKNAGANLATLRRFVLNLFRLDIPPRKAESTSVVSWLPLSINTAQNSWDRLRFDAVALKVNQKLQLNH